MTRVLAFVLVLSAIAGAQGPDRLWCPMHPNVRADAPGRCPECGMALVAIPSRTDVEYWLDVRSPGPIAARRPVPLQLTVRERGSNTAVQSLEEMHERRMHLFVLSYDLSHFEHVHPTAGPDGRWDIALTLPKPGPYRLVADVLPTGGNPQTLQHTFITAGHLLPLASARAAPAAARLEATAGGVRARLSLENARVGDDTHLVLELTGARAGTPVSDLEPYLGAWGHMLLASADLQDIVHSHPLVEDTTPGGPTITFHTLLSRAGWYQVWAQVQREGRILTFPFTVRVAPLTETIPRDRAAAPVR